MIIRVLKLIYFVVLFGKTKICVNSLLVNNFLETYYTI